MTDDKLFISKLNKEIDNAIKGKTKAFVNDIMDYVGEKSGGKIIDDYNIRFNAMSLKKFSATMSLICEEEIQIFNRIKRHYDEMFLNPDELDESFEDSERRKEK